LAEILESWDYRMANGIETEKNILVISDEHDLQQNCRLVLMQRGYQVHVAATGQEGLAKMRTTPFAVALIDVMLPDISGTELLSLTRKRNPAAICIMMSNYANVELAVQVMQLGAYNFIGKPFPEGHLLLAVEQGLEKYRLQQENRRKQYMADEAWRTSQDKAMLDELAQVQSLSMRKIAHELRAPLTAIRSFLTLILQGYVSPDKARHMQERAAERADELLILIDDYLNLAHLKDQRYPSERGVISVEALLADVLALHTPEAEAKGLKLTADIRPCAAISADPIHIKQLWTNLISNAIKYTPKGGRITVRLFPEGGFIVGEVKDTGIGISKEDQPHLFEEFFRTEQARTFAHYGTGLGLSIVKQIVQKHGGSIHVKSDLGQGTLFTFRLPMKQTP
jgi:signal transduction histidine kinase